MLDTAAIGALVSSALLDGRENWSEAVKFSSRSKVWLKCILNTDEPNQRTKAAWILGWGRTQANDFPQKDLDVQREMIENLLGQF